MTQSDQQTQRNFSIREYSEADLPGVLKLMQVSLGESTTLQRTSDLWNWKHRDNRFGHSHVLVATGEANDIVGLRAFLRWRFVRNDQQLSAVRAVDTSTHPDYRRLGMFSKLTLQAVDDVRSAGTDLVFNTPNDRSRPGYLKMGWSTAGQIKPLVKVLNYPKFALGLARYKLRGERDGTKSHPDEAFVRGDGLSLASELLSIGSLGDLISADSARWSGYIRTDRSIGFLDWRYAQHPTINYHAAWVERSGRLEAAAIFRFNTRFGMREVVLSELLLRESDPRLSKELLREVTSRVRGDYMISYAHSGSSQSDMLAKNSFRRLPVGAMTLTYNPLSSRAPERTGLQDWGVGMGDLEFF